jgi:uncharacterized membrane protein HdeD (DUF308 family)
VAADSAADRAAARLARSLRTLYLFRTGFSLFWVALVYALASAQTGQDSIGLLGGTLLVVYPVSDAIATVADLRSGPVVARWPQRLNLVTDLAAAVAILVALRSSLASAIAVFGVWAIGTGALMIFSATQRRRLGGQWLMIISGAGSVFAGAAFVSWTGSSSAGLTTLAQYSAGGAVWYLLAAVWLSWTHARARVRALAGGAEAGQRGVGGPGDLLAHGDHGAAAGAGAQADVVDAGAHDVQAAAGLGQAGHVRVAGPPAPVAGAAGRPATEAELAG